MSDAPFCNVKIATPAGDPSASKGLQRVPNNANMTQLINIVNNNFNALIKGNFQENRATRQVRITRVFNPSDQTQYVDVKEIVGLNFFNPLTGQTLTFKR